MEEIPNSELEASSKPEEGKAREVREVKKRVPTNYQLAEVLVTPTTPRPMVAGIGDVIVHRANASIDFDLIKGTKLIRFFDVVGKWVD